MKTTQLLAFILFLVSYSVLAQKKGEHVFTPAKDHYKEFQSISAKPDPARAWMDTIFYPPSEYGSSIVYLLVKPHYLTEAQIKSLTQSVAFPANSSDQVRKELDYLLDLQSKRTPELVKRVEFLGNIGYWPSVNQVPTHPAYTQNLKDLFFEGRELMGENINAGSFPRMAKLLQGVMQDMRIMEFTIKYKWLRPRPYHLEPKLQPLIRIGSPSFVSGHTLWAFVQAYTWSAVVPERQEDFMRLAEEIRRSREIMGIHYPSDNERAREVAFNMFRFFSGNEAFNKDLKEAVAEWKANAPK